MTNIYGDGYRKAEAKDVGRRVKISNTGDFNTDEWCYLKAIGAKGRYICDHGKDFEFASVPILPGEYSQVQVAQSPPTPTPKTTITFQDHSTEVYDANGNSVGVVCQNNLVNGKDRPGLCIDIVGNLKTSLLLAADLRAIADVIDRFPDPNGP